LQLESDHPQLQRVLINRWYRPTKPEWAVQFNDH